MNDLNLYRGKIAFDDPLPKSRSHAGTGKRNDAEQVRKWKRAWRERNRLHLRKYIRDYMRGYRKRTRWSWGD